MDLMPEAIIWVLLRPRGWFPMVSSGYTCLVSTTMLCKQKTGEDSLHIKFQTILHILRKGCDSLRIANCLFLNANRFWNPWIKLCFLLFPALSDHVTISRLSQWKKEKGSISAQAEFLCWKPPNHRPICRSNFILAVKRNYQRGSQITKKQPTESCSTHSATSNLKLNL